MKLRGRLVDVRFKAMTGNKVWRCPCCPKRECVTNCWPGTTRDPQYKYIARPHEKGIFRWQRQPGNHPVPWLVAYYTISNIADHIAYVTTGNTCSHALRCKIERRK